MTKRDRSWITRTRFGRFAVIFALFAVFGLAALHANHVLTQGTSNAFGESVALTFTALPPLASGSATSGPLPTVSGTAPPAYNLTNSLANASVTATTPSVGTVLTTGVLTVNAASSVPASATTTADATVNNLAHNLGFNLITAFGLNASSVRSTAAIGGVCGALTATGTTTIENGTLIGSLLGASAGASLAVNPAPNTVVGAGAALGTALAAAGITITLNEQIVTGDGTSTRRIIVNAIHIRYTSTNIGGGITTTGDVIIGHSEASATCAISTGTNADLAVTLTDSPDPVPAGNNLTYTATVTNNGPDAATAAVLTNTLPAGVTFVSATASQGTCTESGGVVTCSLGNLAVGANATANIVVRPTSAGTLTNTVSVTATTPDPNTANNTATATTTVTAPTAVAADLALTKTDSPDPVVNGNLTYTLTATNNGPGAAADAVITDQLPAGVTFVSASASQGTCTQSAGTVTCNLGTINAGATATASIVVTPGAAGTLTNTATLSSSTSDPTPGNNTATTTTTVSPQANTNADLAVTLTDNPDPSLVGNALTYTATVTNNGPSTATATVVSITLPAGVTFVQANPSQGTCTQSGGVVTCDLGNVAPGASPTVHVTVTTTAPGTITATANAGSSNPDPTPGNNSASQSTTVISRAASADVALTITDSPDPVPAGNILNYSITATNNGPSTAAGVVVTDTLPAGVTFISAVPSQGTCSQSGGTVTCTLGDLASGASANIQLNVRPTTAGTVTNTATASAGTPDPSGGNNSATASTTVTAPAAGSDADLGITVATSPGTVAVGGTLTFTPTVTNSGPSAADGTIVTFQIPAGVTFVSATASQGSCVSNGTTVTCNLGVVAAGATPTVSIVVRPSVAGSLIGVFSVLSSTPDPNIANSTATATVIIAAPVPTMGEWALMLLGGMLLALGYRRVRRQAPLMVA